MNTTHTDTEAARRGAAATADETAVTLAHAFTPRQSPVPARTVPLEELRRAWAALQAGAFRPRTLLPPPAPAAMSRTETSHALTEPPGAPPVLPNTGPPATQGAVWVPAAGEQVLPVVGCGGSCGASTTAIALATAALTAGPSSWETGDESLRVGRHGGWDAARVVDCGSLTTSGLAAASTAELGRDDSGWWRGTRGEVVLQRGDGYRAGPHTVPAPCPTPGPASGTGSRLTVLDVGWDLEHVLHHPSWLRTALGTASHVVLATTATVPGLRRLEVHLDLLSNPGIWATGASETTDEPRPVPVPLAIVLGPSRRRWPRAALHSLGARSAALDRWGRLTTAPLDRRLAVHGLDPAPLPAPLLNAATSVLHHLITDAQGDT